MRDVVRYLVSEQHCDPACKDFFGETPLHEVCQNGHLDIFRYLVTEQHCDPACKNDYGATPLHEVCRNGHLDIVRYLVTEQHCDPVCKNDYGATPLHEVCRNGHLDIVRYLVTECQCDPLQPLNDGGRSPFSLASSSFHHKVVVFLVSTGKVDLRSILMHIRRWSLDESQVLELLSQYPGAEVNVDMDFWRRERTLLDYSCEKGWYKVVRMLVETEYCCDPRLRDENGNTSLHYACKSGHMGIVKYLVTEQHCDPVCKNHDGRTPLHEACERGHLDIVKYLVTDQHCDPACEDHDGRTPLHEACENGHVDTVKFLVSECHRNPLQPLDDCGDSPFSLASSSFCHKVVVFLVSTGKVDLRSILRHIRRWSLDESQGLELLSQYPGAEVNCNVDMDFWRRERTLLDYSCEKGWYNVVRMLVETYRCDPRLGDENGNTSLHYACKSRHVCIAKYLVTDQHCDPACKNHDGRTPLHEACENGRVDTVKFLVSECKCDPLQPDKNGQTPCSLALSNHHVRVTTFLVSIGKAIPKSMTDTVIVAFSNPQPSSCDEAQALQLLSRFPQQSVIKDIRNEGSERETLLHYACWNGWYEVVRVLVEQYHCDPKCQDREGYTPLHDACGDTAQLDIVRYLVTELGCDPLQPNKYGLTALDRATNRGHADVVAFFTTEVIEFIAAFSSSHPFKPALKVFVLGNSSAGKSTLIKAIQNRLTDTTIFGSFTDRFRRVSGVELCTAGIVPVLIESPKGDIILYDFAGQYQYYSSHAALLESLVSSPGSLILMVVDLSQSREEITRTLQYWNCFIENVHGRPEVYIVGSHVDLVKSQGGSQKVSDIVGYLTSHSSTQFVNQVFTINCTQLASDGLNKICNVISESCIRIQETFTIAVQVHLLHAFIWKKFSDRSACRVVDILAVIASEQVERQNRLAFVALLPTDPLVLSQHLATISNRGQFLYLRNDKIEDGWVILDKQVLLSEVNGTVFAPETFKQHHNIASSTGIVPFSKIEEEFPTHDPDMIVSFLTHLEFCQQIAESEACLISTEVSQGHSPPFYFFPALVSEDRPTESGQSFEQAHYKSGWVIRCSRPNQFLSPRFLHVLLLRLAFSFGLAPEPADEDGACPVLQRKCNVWNSGIHWQNRDAVEGVVEVVEQNTAVTVMMGCMEGSVIACMRVRSRLIRTILAAKERFCGAVEVRESLVHPAELGSYPLRSPHFLTSFTITELATAIAEGKPAVTHKQGQRQEMLKIENLLHFEPYACLNLAILSRLFSKDNPQKEVPDDFLMDMAKAGHTSIDDFKTILNYNESELQVAIGQLVPPYQSSSIHHCYLVFRTWKECSGHPANSYNGLREALDEYSVFCGRNPLVSPCVCILVSQAYTCVCEHA